MSGYALVRGRYCNIVYDCLDRYMEKPVRNKVAFCWWEGENGARRIYSYSRLYDEVNQLPTPWSAWA